MENKIEKVLKADFDLLTNKFSHIRESFAHRLSTDKTIAIELTQNSYKALNDLRSGTVFNDDAAAENLRNSLIDILKVSGMIGFFILPGGTIGLIVMRRLLKTHLAARTGIENLLTLSIVEKLPENK